MTGQPERLRDIKITPPESTLRAIGDVEKAADSLMRLGDTQNAIRLYSLALRLRAGAGHWEESDEPST